MTTAAAGPSRARSAWRPATALLLVLLVLLVTGVAVALPRAGTAAQGWVGLAFAAVPVGSLLRRAPRTRSPGGWRWYAAAVALSASGAAVVPHVTGMPGTSVLGIVPGQLLVGVALQRMGARGRRRGGTAQLLVTAALLAVATALTMHELLSLVPDGPGSPPLLLLALRVVPVAVALTTAALLLLAAGSGPERSRVVVALLAAQAFSAASCATALGAWGTGWSGLQALTWPAVGASVVAVCVACTLDSPGSGRPGRSGGALPALLPHLLALVAGGLLLSRISTTHVVDTADGLLALTGLVLLAAHQAGMWLTQRRLTDQLQRSESCFRTLVRCSVDPVVLLDEDLTVTFASPSIADLVGVEASAVVGRHVAVAVHPDDVALLAGALSGDRPGGGSTVRTARLRHADGSWRLIQATVRDLREDPDVDALVLFCRDVTPRSAVPGIDPELLELALTDPVTGLPNRTALVRRLAAVQRGAAGQTGTARTGAVALLGVDGLADAEAAAPGTADAVLRAVTSRLTRVLRGEDWLARGKDGDFVVLVEGSIADAEVVASRLVAGVGSLATPDGPVRLTAVAGVAALAADVDPGAALRRCAVALDSARRAGPGSVHRYDDALRIQQDRSAALRTDLAGAIARGELRLVFQPVVDLVLQRSVSVEALLRWRHPVFGDVPPVEFVPLAEESALISDLGRWVLREACAGIAALPGSDLSVAVNVSTRHVRSGELVADVLAALEAGGLPASRLVVEITESVLVDDPHVVEDLAVLRSLGVRVAVDDFGTGWSSLAYLVGLPVDILKMDQHFLADLETDPQRQALCRAVLQLGGSLGLPVVVEGVTTDAQLDLLRDMGHRFVQGFAFSRPLETAELLDGVRRTGGPAAIPFPRSAPGARVVAP